jgi:guanylate kinase
LCAHDDRFVLSRSWTTRPRRPSDDDDSYTFVTRDEFEDRVAAGGFLEWATYHGNLYGTPTPDPTDERHLVLNIELQGAGEIAERFPDAAVLVLLEPPHDSVLEQRLRGRGDPEETLQQRLATALEELAEGRKIAHATVVNDDLTRAVGEVRRILDNRLSGGM